MEIRKDNRAGGVSGSMPCVAALRGLSADGREVICLSCGRKFVQRGCSGGRWTNRQCIRCGGGYLVEVLRDGNGGLTTGSAAGDGRLPEAKLDYVEELLAPRGSAPSEEDWEE